MGRLRHAASAVLGVLVSVGAVAAWAMWNAALPELLWTTFVYPWEAVSVPGAASPYIWLARSAWWFGWSFLATCLLSLLGLGIVFRRGLGQFDMLALSWLVFGILIVVVQRSSWWSWHTLLILVPLGLFAGRGVDLIASRWGEMKPAARAGISAAVLLAMVPAGYAFLAKAIPLATNGFALSDGDRIQYEEQIWPLYGELREDGAFLDESAANAGPVYVFGDPTYNYVFERDQALPVNGWSPQYWNQAMWERVHDDLVQRRPPYVQVAPWAAELMRDRHAQTQLFLESRYELVKSSVSGTWYAAR